LLKLEDRFLHRSAFASGCHAVFYKVVDDNLDDSVQRGSYSGDLVDDLRITSIVLHHLSDGSDMPLDS
jgi:hypothetical protein